MGVLIGDLQALVRIRGDLRHGFAHPWITNVASILHVSLVYRLVSGFGPPRRKSCNLFPD